MKIALIHRSKKVCQSAIKGESVTNIRKYLNKTHSLWINRHDNEEFNLKANIGISSQCTYDMQQFCFDFVLGNHLKRQQRNREKKLKDKIKKEKKNSICKAKKKKKNCKKKIIKMND